MGERRRGVRGPTRDFHDQTLPGDNYKEARFCSMCGAESCSMRIDQDAREDGEMDRIADATALDASSAAAVNRPPIGTHDTSRVPELPPFLREIHEDERSGAAADD